MEEDVKPKIGAGHAAGMFRAGLKELAQVLPAFPDSIKPVEEQGIAGNVTNIEVVREKEADVEDPRAEARARAMAAEQSKEREIGD